MTTNLFKALPEQFAALWQDGDSPPDVSAFLRRHHNASPQEQLQVVLVDISSRRKFAVTMLPLNYYLQQCPAVTSDQMLRRQVEEAYFAAIQPSIASQNLHSDLSLGRINEILGESKSPQDSKPYGHFAYAGDSVFEKINSICQSYLEEISSPVSKPDIDHFRQYVKTFEIDAQPTLV